MGILSNVYPVLFAHTATSHAFNSFGDPRRQFSYILLIPRLQGYFQNPSMVKRLSYRANYEAGNRSMSDIFDGIHYQTLLETEVIIDAHPLGQSFFDDH